MNNLYSPWKDGNVWGLIVGLVIGLAAYAYQASRCKPTFMQLCGSWVHLVLAIVLCMMVCWLVGFVIQNHIDRKKR